jgi:transcriptional regulator with XRE-family HTH domain
MGVNYSLVGERIATRRKQLKLTQAELAEKASLTSKYISKIESSTNRALSIASVLQICEALSVSPSFLLLGTNDNNPNPGYDDAVQKLKLCDTEQLRYVSKFIDAITSD